MLLEAPWDPSLNEYAAPRLSKLTREGAWDASETLASVLNDNGGVALKVSTSAIFKAGSDSYVLGAIAKQLCRLGESDIACFAGELMTEPSSSTIYETSFYYLATDTILSYRKSFFYLLMIFNMSIYFSGTNPYPARI